MKETAHTLWGVLLLSCVMGSSCRAVPRTTRSVEVATPKAGERLRIGHPFEVKADITSDRAIDYVEVTLWDVATGYENTWRFDFPSSPISITLSEELAVPTDAPPGRDYRLEVGAFPGATVSGYPELSAAPGFSIQVIVEPATP